MSRVNTRQIQWDFFLNAIQSARKEGCLLWPFGKLGAGYPSIKNMQTGKVMGAHRLACIMMHGNPPTPKMHAAHTCGKASCFNPHHMWWATAKQNAADKRKHGTNNDGEKHGLSVLTNEQAKAIRAEVDRGKRGDQARLARKYGVSVMTISMLVRGKTYAEVL